MSDFDNNESIHLNDKKDIVDELSVIYAWVDQTDFSREKKDINRDFHDGVLIAELIKSNIPSLIDVHNYIPTNNKERKRMNWLLLNKKVFIKLGFQLSDEEIDNIVNSRKNCVNSLLRQLYVLIKNYKAKLKAIKSKENDESLNKKLILDKKADYVGIKINKREDFDIANIKEIDLVIKRKEKELQNAKLLLYSIEDDLRFYTNKLYDLGKKLIDEPV